MMSPETLTKPPPETATTQHTVFRLWCRLTGAQAFDFGDEEREAFLARPEVPFLAGTPYEVLLDAGITAARRGSLPLQRWLAAVRVVRPERLGRSRSV
ncbi:MAG: hypothetical protein M3140_08230 [Actinomycetota bacterium]|nr:hypothetical protein [Actinomycetota bacterium]